MSIWYISANILFVLSCLVGMQIEGNVSEGSIVFIILLFSMCSTPLLYKNIFYGRHLLYTLFMAYMFLAYGIFQFVDLYFDFEHGSYISRDGYFAKSELIILAGIFAYSLSFYLVSNFIFTKSSNFASRNWKLKYLVVIGIISWLIGVYVHIDWSMSTDILSSNSFSQNKFSGIYVNLRSFMMLGELMLIFSFAISQNKKIGLLVLALIVFGILIGLITDSKEIGFRSLVLFFFVNLILHGRVNVKLALVGMVVIVIGFSIFAQSRHFRHTHYVTTQDMLSNFTQNISKAASQSNKNDIDLLNRARSGLGYLLWRSSLNGSTELIVMGLSEGIPYRYGSTLTPVFYAFIPRFLLPDKPDANIGRFINQEFSVSESELTYIAIGQLAEFYWNFGLLGVIVGMSLIGILFAFLGASFDLSHRVSITRLLLLLSTVYVLVLRFEGGFATYYTVWIRMVVLILILHLLIPKVKKIYKRKS